MPGCLLMPAFITHTEPEENKKKYPKLMPRTTIQYLPDTNKKVFPITGGAFRRPDYGLNFGAGIQCKKLAYAAEFDLGLPNITRPNIWQDAPTDQSTYRTGVVSLSVAYLF